MGAMRAYFLVNGIATFPGDARNWNGRGVTHIHTASAFQAVRPTAAVAEKIEYLCGPIGRAFGQRDRAEKLYRTLTYYRGFECVLVGHSNGADVILRCLRDWSGWPAIAHLHLVCAATGADCERNGINHWLRTGRVERVTVYVAGRDRALRLASTWVGRLLGYGCLGLHGPRRVAADVRDQVRTVRWPRWGHSDCWGDAAFETTMDSFKG